MQLSVRGGRTLKPIAGERVASAELVVHLLGGFTVFAGNRSIEAGAWRLRKASGLVKLLALADGHRLHREQVMDRLWPDRPPEAAANNLRVTLHAARRLLEAPPLIPDVIVARDDWLAFAPNLPVWVDVVAFETAAGRCDVDPGAYHSALALYRGDLLPGDPYEDWLMDRRGALRETHLALLRKVACLHEERGETDLAIESLERALAVDPALEDAHVCLMRLHALAGRRSDALRQYPRLRTGLSRELDVEPDIQSTRLYEDILERRFPAGPESGRPPAGNVAAVVIPDARTNLPLQLTSFVGRAREIGQVQHALGQHRLVTLTGPGGSGKTRLALHVASEMFTAYPDGVWLVELSAITHPAHVPRAVGSTLALREAADHAGVEGLAGALAERRLLLVLDNCEHLVAACREVVDALLRACPLLRVMATSREALGVPGEMVVAAPPLSTPHPRRLPSLDAIATADAVRLFIERARLLKPALSVTDDNAAAIVQICRKLEGLPLAIELAAARVRALSVQQIAARLDDALPLLTGGARTTPTRQRTMQASLDWSHDLLDSAEQALLRRLAVFAGGCTLEAAEMVCSEGEAASGANLDLLFQLADKSLLVVEDLHGEVRYRLLEPIRQYAAQRLHEAGETMTVRRRHLAWCITLGVESEAGVRGVSQVEWLDRLEREHDNLRLALDLANADAGAAEQALHLAWSLWRFWDARDHQVEGHDWLGGLLALPANAERTPLRARALYAQARMALQLGRYPDTQRLTLESLSIAREHADDELIAAALNQLGHVTRSQGRFAEAREYYEEGLALRRGMDDKRSISLALGGLGRVVLAQGDHDYARSLFQECLALRRAVEDRQGIAIGLMFLGTEACYRADYAAAAAFHTESMALLRDLGDRHRGAEVLDRLALARLGQGDLDAARCHATASLTVNREAMDRVGAARSLEILGLVALEHGNVEEAGGLLAESIAHQHALMIHEQMPGCLEGLARVLLLRDEHGRCARLLGAAAFARDAIGAPLPPASRAGHERTVEAARAALGEKTYATCWSAGWMMTLDEAVAEALTSGSSPKSGAVHN